MRMLRNKNTGAIFGWSALLAELDYMEVYEPLISKEVVAEPIVEESIDIEEESIIEQDNIIPNKPTANLRRNRK